MFEDRKMGDLMAGLVLQAIVESVLGCGGTSRGRRRTERRGHWERGDRRFFKISLLVLFFVSGESSLGQDGTPELNEHISQTGNRQNAKSDNNTSQQPERPKISHRRDHHHE